MTDATVLAQREDIERSIAGQTTCHLLERNAREHPEAPALSWGTTDGWKTMDWRSYREYAAAVALGLAELGVGHNDVVALMGANRWEHVIADAGVVHTGATPTTFYSTLAPDQIKYVANNCGAKVAILENPDYLKQWREIRGELDALEHIVLVDDADAVDDEEVESWDALLERGRRALDAEPDRFEQLWQRVAPDDPATLIYTSGTTGPPKGTLITQHNVMYEAEALDRATGLSDELTGVSYLPLAHIAERVLSIYLPLRKRAHVYFCPDPASVVEYVQQARPTFFFGVPRVWEKVQTGVTAKLEAEPDARKRKLADRARRIGEAVTRLQEDGRRPSPLLRVEHALLDRLVLSRVREGIGLDRCEFASSSAAPLPRDVGRFFASLGLPLVEVWGMTELTGAATGYRPEDLKIGRVGPALPGIELTVAEDDGEVLVRGPIVVPGYLNLPEETSELIDDDGWVHSGDVGELDEDGYLRIVDRKKELIITAGGKNLSPANIESVLKEHPLVGQALAYGNNKPYVVALLVLDEEMAPEWARQHGLEATEVAELAQHPTVREEIDRAVAQANEKLARVEQVKRYTLLTNEWTPESEELTPTMKLKRRVIHDKYADQIEALYA